MPNDDAKADPNITVTDELDPADVAVITDGLGAYDFSQIGYRDFRRLAVFVRDPQTGKVVGGLYGRSEFGLVYVDWLFLPEELRCRGDDRLRPAWPHALLHAEEALTHGGASPAMRTRAREALRDRLIALRDDALRQLAALDHLAAGLLRVVGDTSAALAAIETASAERPNVVPHLRRQV